MYNHIKRTFIAAAALFVTSITSANVGENFNSRKGISLQQVRSSLQGSCWTFHHFDVNVGGWNPSIEGDGAMVSSATALSSGNAGIYTPVLKVGTWLNISFNYRFSEDFNEHHSRWIRLCLAGPNNEIIQVLEHIDCIGSSATLVRKFSTRFENLSPGEYRLVVLYGGTGGSANIAIDELNTSAPFLFADGCEKAPAAHSKEITGLADRTAQGTLELPDAAHKQTFLVRDAENGTVNLSTDGTFVFIPNKGFKGNSTSFIYRVCNDLNGNLCSDPMKVNIRFPSGQPVLLNTSYKQNGLVELAWNAEEGTGTDTYTLERSTDGKSWMVAATREGQKATNGNVYTYLDKVGKNTALKRDLYYRLRKTGEEGSVTSRPMIVRVYNNSSLTLIGVSPNPVKREVMVNVQLQESSMVSLRLMNQSQEVLIHKTVEAAAGINNIAVPGSAQLAPGNYLLEVVVNSKERMLVKLVRD